MENLGRLGAIVPFLPLQLAGRRAVVERQLDALKHFEQEKAKMDAELKQLNETIMRDQIGAPLFIQPAAASLFVLGRFFS